MLPISGSLLLVDDDVRLARSLARLVRQRVPAIEVVQVNSYFDALSLVRSPDVTWSAFLFDLRLETSLRPLGIDLLEKARERFPATPAVIMTAFDDKEATRRAARLNAHLVPKPIDFGDLAPLLAAAATYEAGLQGPLAGVIRDIARTYGLSAMQTKILAANMSHRESAELLGGLGITANTYKRHATEIRERLQVGSLRAACALVWARVAGERPSPPLSASDDGRQLSLQAAGVIVYPYGHGPERQISPSSS